MSFKYKCVITFLLISLCTLCGCAANYAALDGFSQLQPIRRYCDTDGQKEIELTTEHYRILTDTELSVAQQAGRFMEKALLTYQTVSGIANDNPTHMTIYIYSDRDRYLKAAEDAGLDADMSTGFFTPELPAAIHIPWVGTRSNHPLLTLVHEGFHQFIQHNAIATQVLNGTIEKIAVPIDVPIWLNEGMAQFMEGAVVNEHCFIPGRIYQARLVHLQENLLKPQPLNLEVLVTDRYAAPFSNRDYSASWGLVFALYHGLTASGEWSGKNQIPIYLQKLKDRLKGSSVSTKPDAHWDRILAKQSLLAILDIFHQQGTTLSGWEKFWRSAILNLKPDDPFFSENLQIGADPKIKKQAPCCSEL